MHYLYSSIISQKFIVEFFNKSIYCICIKSINVFFFFILLPRWGSYIFVKKRKFEILVSEYSKQYKTSRNVIFSWRPEVCVCVRVCPIFNVWNPDDS